MIIEASVTTSTSASNLLSLEILDRREFLLELAMGIPFLLLRLEFPCKSFELHALV
jgi:hypothetical protein